MEKIIFTNKILLLLDQSTAEAFFWRAIPKRSARATVITSLRAYIHVYSFITDRSQAHTHIHIAATVHEGEENKGRYSCTCRRYGCGHARCAVSDSRKTATMAAAAPSNGGQEESPIQVVVRCRCVRETHVTLCV